MYREKLIRFFEEAKKTQTQETPVEVEVRFGKIIQGEFVAGLDNGRFRFLKDWFTQSSLEATPWTESVSSYFGKNKRVIVVKNANNTVANCESIEKKPISILVLSTNHPEGIAFKFAAYAEKNITNTNIPQTISLVRLRERKSFFINSKDYEKSFSVDFTLVWASTSEKLVKEMQRHGRLSSFEVEMEITNEKYLKEMSAPYLADSFSLKLKNLFKDELGAEEFEFSFFS